MQSRPRGLNARDLREFELTQTMREAVAVIREAERRSRSGSSEQDVTRARDRLDVAFRARDRLDVAFAELWFLNEAALYSRLYAILLSRGATVALAEIVTERWLDRLQRRVRSAIVQRDALNRLGGLENAGHLIRHRFRRFVVPDAETDLYTELNAVVSETPDDVGAATAAGPTHDEVSARELMGKVIQCADERSAKHGLVARLKLLGQSDEIIALPSKTIAALMTDAVGKRTDSHEAQSAHNLSKPVRDEAMAQDRSVLLPTIPRFWARRGRPR